MVRDEKLDHLRRVPLFRGLKPREMERLGQLADEIVVGMDTLLTEQGHLAHEFFIVMDGHLTVIEDGRPVAQLHPGDFFGEIALVDGRPRTATVRAEGLTRLLVVGHREFHALMDAFPSVRDVVLAELAERLRRVEGHPPA